MRLAFLSLPFVTPITGLPSIYVLISDRRKKVIAHVHPVLQVCSVSDCCVPLKSERV